MIRKTLIIASLIGLVLSLGTWGVSYTVLGWSNGRTIISLSGGAIRYVEFTNLTATKMVVTWSGFTNMDTAVVPRAGWSGGSRRSGMCYLVIPLWIPSILSAFVLWVSYHPLYRRRRRRKLGLCLDCGYNLTGNVTGVCSECGSQISHVVERI